MKQLTLLATLLLLTSCDVINSAQPKPSVTLTPVASDSPDPNALSASSNGVETPGPTSSGLPTPSVMPKNPSPAASSGLTPTSPTTQAASNTLLNPSTNQAPATVAVNSPPTQTQVPAVKQSPPSKVVSGQDSAANPNGNLSGTSGNTKESSKEAKPKSGKGAKGVDDLPPSGSTTQSAATPKIPPSQAIADGGIGVAKVGITVAELKKSLKNSARFETTTDFAPGYNALAVKQRGKVQFYIPYPKNKKVTDNDQIKFLVTDNPLYKTAEGVYPGMSIKKATDIYGGAQLAFNPKVKSQEIVSFANQPGEISFFSSGAESGGRAGIYPKKSSENPKNSSEKLFVTDKFGASGKLKRIIVVCPESICPAEQPN
jgi:hypothetical protein